jgi:hypothetical protein
MVAPLCGFVRLPQVLLVDRGDDSSPPGTLDLSASDARPTEVGLAAPAWVLSALPSRGLSVASPHRSTCSSFLAFQTTLSKSWIHSALRSPLAIPSRETPRSLASQNHEQLLSAGSRSRL